MRPFITMWPFITMRAFIAGFLTLVTFVTLYILVPKLKASCIGLGTTLPKHIEFLIVVSNICVNYFYVLIPLLFVKFLYLIGLVGPGTNRKEG
jgi:type II secretory pathway component PulF